jgi:hypothetical protein
MCHKFCAVSSPGFPLKPELKKSAQMHVLVTFDEPLDVCGIDELFTTHLNERYAARPDLAAPKPFRCADFTH